MRIQQVMLDLFWDEQEGGFYFTARDSEKLLVRDKEIYDGAVPSSNSVAALNLLRLARMTGNTTWEEQADRMFKAFFHLVSDFPSAYTQFLQAVDFALGPGKEMVIAGDLGHEATQRMVATIHRRFLAQSGVAALRTGRRVSETGRPGPFYQRSAGGRSWGNGIPL